MGIYSLQDGNRGTHSSARVAPEAAATLRLVLSTEAGPSGLARSLDKKSTAQPARPSEFKARVDPTRC